MRRTRRAAASDPVLRAVTATLLGTLVLTGCSARAPRSCARTRSCAGAGDGTHHAAARGAAVRGTARGHATATSKLRPGVTAIGLAVDPATSGYWILRSNGGVNNFHAPWQGGLLGKVPAGASVTAIAAGRANGYLILTSDGGVHAFGTPWHGSDAGRLPPGVQAVGLAVDTKTGGYWIVRSDGVVNAFDAPARGSVTGALPAGAAVLATAAGRPGGYLVLASHGAVPAELAGRWLTVIPTRRKVVALTFDIGAPNLGGLPRVLATLRRDHVPATFFLIGAWVHRFNAAARAIVASGAVIGDLSLDHPHFPRIPDETMREQVLSAQTEITSVTGARPWPWFRFPFGDYNAHTIAVVNSLGYATIGWTVDTLGWMGTSRGITVRSIVQRVVAARQPGEIVLMHPAATVDHSILDARALPAVITALRSYGYSFTTINALRKLGFRVSAAVATVRAFGTPWYGSDARGLPAGVTAIGLAADPAGGYWILRSDGVVDAFHAPWHGDLAGKVPPGYTVTAIAAAPDGGYLILTSNGGVHAFGTPWYGSDVAAP